MLIPGLGRIANAFQGDIAMLDLGERLRRGLAS